MSVLKRLLERFFSQDKRKSERKPAPQLAAYFWTGAAPKAHGVRDISSTGLYLLTEERWYPGTLLMMTLQIRNDGAERQATFISVQAKTVRWGEDGVGLEFLLPEANDPRRGQTMLADGADRKSLERFLEEFLESTGTAVVDYVVPPDSSRAEKT